MSDVTDPIKSIGREAQRAGERAINLPDAIEDELGRFDDRLRRGIEPRTGASEMRREAERVREDQRAQAAQAEQQQARSRRRRENMMRAALQPQRSLFDLLGTTQTTDRLG